MKTKIIPTHMKSYRGLLSLFLYLLGKIGFTYSQQSTKIKINFQNRKQKINIIYKVGGQSLFSNHDFIVLNQIHKVFQSQSQFQKFMFSHQHNLLGIGASLYLLNGIVSQAKVSQNSNHNNQLKVIFEIENPELTELGNV